MEMNRRFVTDRPGSLGIASVLTLAALAGAARGQQRLYQLLGDGDGDRFGSAIAVVGDIDGDGFGDFVVGAPGNDAAATDAGQIKFVSGASGSILREIRGNKAGDRFGESVAPAGDLNGDGAGDLLVSSLDAATLVGTVDILSGSDGALIDSLAGKSGTFFGIALAGGSDLDRDGVSDLVIGAPDDGTNGSRAGAVHVYSGATRLLSFSIFGAHDGAHCGSALALLGDVDGDGVSDLAIGAPGDYEFSSLARRGSIRLFSGASGAPLWSLFGRKGETFGLVIAAGGDFDGDGIPDLGAGLPTSFSSPGIVAAGGARLLSGRDGHVLFETIGDDDRQGLGAALALAADVNGDGLSDLLIGEEATSLESVQLRSGRSFGLLQRLRPEADGGGFCQTVAFLGDVDGDGFSESIVGAPLATAPSGTRPGAVSVIGGNNLYLSIEPPRASPGEIVELATRDGTPGNATLLFLTSVNGASTFVALPPVGSFDATFARVIDATVPPGLSGLDIALRAFAIGPAGRLVDSNDTTLSFL